MEYFPASGLGALEGKFCVALEFSAENAACYRLAVEAGGEGVVKKAAVAVPQGSGGGCGSSCSHGYCSCRTLPQMTEVQAEAEVDPLDRVCYRTDPVR